ncbi:unnamed protein product, partial [Dovyalis caffra]
VIAWDLRRGRDARRVMYEWIVADARIGVRGWKRHTGEARCMSCGGPNRHARVMVVHGWARTCEERIAMYEHTKGGLHLGV